MSFMNAKQARPVKDASALVPFGWAPGGYYCTACSTCGEAHSGSDKRSMRCQDCAEALRDKRADEPATTRETADHVELTRLRQHIANLKLRPGHHVQFGTPSVSQISNYWNRDLADDLEALLSEIVALRVRAEEADALASKHFVALREKQDDAAVLKHGKLEAERQRDEAVGLLRKLTDRVKFTEGEGGRRSWSGISVEFVRAFDQARAFLANQGADQ